ncbi:MAG: hypothetical protein IJP92_09960 [Lachnospiraceae bacterium]|nr:hypothetical protein [Lachnospiraceae bacterium]
MTKENQELLNAINKRFDRIEERLDRIEERLDEHDKRFDRIEERLDRIEERLDAHDKRFDEHDKRFDGIERSIVTIMEEQTKMRILFENEIRDEIRVISERNAETLANVTHLTTQYFKLANTSDRLEIRVDELEAGMRELQHTVATRLVTAS